MKLTFSYSNGTKEVFNKIRVSVDMFDLFYSTYNTTYYNTTVIGPDASITINITSNNRPYIVHITVKVYTNKTSYYEYLKGKFMLYPVNSYKFKEYTAELKAETIKIEDSPTDNDTKYDVFLVSSWVIGKFGFTFDVPDLLDIGPIIWLYGMISGYGTPSLYLPSAYRIVPSMVADYLSHNVNVSSLPFRVLELFTFYNIFMIPDYFNWSIIENISATINSFFGVQMTEFINTSTEVGIETVYNILPTVNDMKLGNCSIQLRVIWDKQNYLAKEFGVYLNYFDVGLERDITMKLSYTTMSYDSYPDPPSELTQEEIQTWFLWLLIGLIAGIGVGAVALGFSIYNYTKTRGLVSF